MASSDEIGLVWFRRDLRLDDNPAWAAATNERKYVVALFVHDPRLMRVAGPYRRRMITADLQAFDYDLAELTGGRLVFLTGDPVAVVPDVADRLGAGAVYWNDDVSPFSVRRDERVTEALDRPVHTFHGSLVHPPGSVTTKKGSVHLTFHSYWRAWHAEPIEQWPEAGTATVYPDPAEALPRLDAPPPLPEGPSEARRRLDEFLGRIDRFDDESERVDLDVTSHLSADLRFGTLAARRVAEVVAADRTGAGSEAFLRQLAWRDWCAHLLAERPELITDDYNDRLAEVTWLNQPAALSAWKGGFTGFPIIDAGMRQLRQTGWMPQRVRALTAGFLVKHLLCDWRLGERHLRGLLVDGDLASNVVNWQWVAGSGPDAAPVAQVIDPVEQSRLCDPGGEYIRRWVPELAMLDSEAIHEPWSRPEACARVGITLGVGYPRPIVDHEEAAQRFRIAAGLEQPPAEAGDADASEAGAADEPGERPADDVGPAEADAGPDPAPAEVAG
jgi:deoxyribodipyrimidine photo-lyase